MDFDFSEEQYLFRDTVRAFLADRLGEPKPDDLDPNENLTENLWSGLTDLGVFSALIPEQYGGLGLSFVDLALVLEEFGRVLVSPSVVDTLVATDVLVRHGSEELKARTLPLIAHGRLSIAVAICESGSGYDVSGFETKVTDVSERERLIGSKILVASAKSAEFVMVATGDKPNGGLLIIDRGRPGINLREQRTLDILDRYHEMKLVQVEVWHRDWVGEERSSVALQRLLDAGAMAAALIMTGISEKVLDQSVEYAKQRSQFGKLIGSFQAIKHRCADMAVRVESSRSAAYYAAWSLANNSPDQLRAVSIAKSFCGDTARFVCNEGIQLHGGMGFTWELGLHLYLRRAKMLESSYGDAIHHRKRVISESLRAL